MKNKKIPFQEKNGWCHKSMKTMKKLYSLIYFFLFSEIMLVEEKHCDNEKIIRKTDRKIAMVDGDPQWALSRIMSKNNIYSH